MQILVVGNEINPEDSLPIQLMDQLKQEFKTISFVHWDPTEELPENTGKNLWILDTVLGIQTVTIFNNLDEFLLSPRNTTHDFDLPVALKLLQKLGEIETVTIIGVPSISL